MSDWSYDTTEEQIRAMLIGRQIAKIEVSIGEELLRLTMVDGSRALFTTEADCCSETWFADILGPSLVFGKTIRAIVDRDMGGYNTNDGRGRQEEDEAYGFTIKTDGGDLDVVFRNSSNGYYGGSASMVDGSAEPSPRNGAAVEWKNITDDWQA